MDRDQAEKALNIIRGVIENTKEDLVEHNWGKIWLLHSISNSIAFASIGWAIEPRGLPIIWYLVPLAIAAVVNMTIILLCGDRDRGTRSYVEWQIHGIWGSFIVVTLVGAVVIYLTDSPPRLFGPLIALTSSYGFAMMGFVFYGRFVALAVVFLLLAIASATNAFHHYQWYLLALGWGLAMFVPGLILYLERHRRAKSGRQARIL